MQDLSLHMELPVVAMDIQQMDTNDRQRLIQILEDLNQISTEAS